MLDRFEVRGARPEGSDVSPRTSNLKPRAFSQYRLAFVLLMLSVALVFWRALFTSDVLFYRDITYLHYAHSFELRELVHSGWPPLWNPYEHFGEPITANPVYLLFYPTTWLGWLLPAAYGFKLHYIIHFFLAAAGSFLLARRAGLGPFACYLAGALFVFSGPVMSLGNFVNFLPAAAWMPLVVLAADYQVRRGGCRGALLFGSAIALQFFCGEPLTSLATAMLAAGWVFALYGDWRGKLWARVNRTLAARLTGGFALAAGLAAVQLFPAAWHARTTERAAELSLSRGLFWSLHPIKFLDILIPEFWGNSLLNSTPWLEVDGPYLLLSVFIGVIPVVFAVIALLRARSRASWFWGASGLAALLLALGKMTPLGEVFYFAVPIFQVARFPAKFLIPASLALAQLAAIGVEQMASGAGSRTKPEANNGRAMRLLALALAGLAVAWFVASAFVWCFPDAAGRLAYGLAETYFQHERTTRLRIDLFVTHRQAVDRAAGWLLHAVPARLPYLLGSLLLMVALVGTRLPRVFRRRLALLAALAAALQLAATHYALNPTVSRRFFEDRSPVLPLLRPWPAPGAERPRIFAEPLRSLAMDAPRMELDISRVDFLPDFAQALYVYRMGLQVSAPWDGVEGTFSVDAERFLPAPQQFLNTQVFDYGLTGDRLARVLRAAGVDYALLVRFAAVPGLRLLGTAPNGTLTPVRVYRIENAVPRAYVVHQATVVSSPGEGINRLMSPDFDPASQVVLDREQLQQGLPPLLPESPGASSMAASAVRMVRNVPLRVEIEADLPRPGLLVLAHSYSADWKAEVDGAGAQVLRANEIFRAVALPAGRHRVVFRYRPAAFYLGAGVTLFTLLLGLWFSKGEARYRSSTVSPQPSVLSRQS
jgi:hypothetical protein